MLFNWDVSRIQRSFWGQVFEAFATGICILTVQNMATAELDIDRILSVCVSVCMSVHVFFRPLFGPVRARIQLQFHEKNTQKTRSHPARDAEMDRFRCHLAEVVALSSNGDCGATFPLGLIGGVAVGDLPPRVQF